MLDFPVLGEEYLTLLAGHYAKIHRGKPLDLPELQRVFARVDAIDGKLLEHAPPGPLEVWLR